jgi:hypothetical protein
MTGAKDKGSLSLSRDLSDKVDRLSDSEIRKAWVSVEFADC